MYEQLKERVLAANLRLPRAGLAPLTWGNASEIDRAAGVVAIKPSGVPYDGMCAADIVVTDLDGNVVDGKYRPSCDLATHLVLYRAFPEIGGVVHTHSRFATVFAQAGRSIPPLGTTHADGFYGAVPCTRALTPDEIAGEYERETGNVIAETLAGRDALSMPAILVRSHGPFTWGKNAEKAVDTAVTLEEAAAMAWYTLALAPDTPAVGSALLDRHYFRKHGKNATYGQ